MSAPVIVAHGQFLYKCTTGLMADKAWGCIMADEMGLGRLCRLQLCLALFAD